MYISFLMLKIYIFKPPKQTAILSWEVSNFQKMTEIEIKLFPQFGKIKTKQKRYTDKLKKYIRD